MASFRETFSGKRLICCALTNIVIMVGQSMDSIYDLGGIFTSSLRTSVNMSPTYTV